MATVRVRIAILTVRITLSACPFNRMAHTANTVGGCFLSTNFAVHSTSNGMRLDNSDCESNSSEVSDNKDDALKA
jgi:hypothetical protein